MKFAIVVLLAVVVGVFGHGGGRGRGRGNRDCQNECSIDKPDGSITDKQVQQIREIIDGALGPNVAKIVAPTLTNVVQKLPIIKSVSPGAFDLVIQLLKPCGAVERFLANGKTPSFNQQQSKDRRRLQKRLEGVVGPNTACFLARIITILNNGALSSAQLQTVAKLINLVLCVASNKALVKALQPILKIVQSLLSARDGGNAVGGLLGGIGGDLLKNPFAAVSGLLKAAGKDLNKCLKEAGIDIQKIGSGIFGGVRRILN